jgi:hypothetical protein
MKTTKIAALLFGVLLASFGQSFGQNNLQFTGVKATSEKAIQLYWASNTNEVYEVDYADQLAGNSDGSTAWNKLYEDYPSQGTNTFIADAGNYDITPQIPHPKSSPMRFYRIMLVEGNTIAANPTVSILSVTNGASLSSDVTISVAASTGDVLTDVKLFIDGEEQWSSVGNTNSGGTNNFVINTCEWPNGSHTIFATVKSQSGLEGAPNGGVISYGRAVSPYLNVTFDNLITRFDFSQPYFEPDLGQTQQVTAAFTANCDWTLQIQDASLNTVRFASGSGSSMEFDWDGTGTNGASLPNGVYSYLLTAQTNGQAFMSMMSGGSGSFSSSALASVSSVEEASELWALPENGDGFVPLALYPPGFDTNGFTIIEASQSQVRALTEAVIAVDRPAIQAKSAMLTDSGSSGGGMMAAAAYSSPSQNTRGPKRKPRTGVKGEVGSFGICYKTYGTNGFGSPHPLTGWPYPLPTKVAIDGQSATALTVDYRVQQFQKMADDFNQIMVKAAWKQAFVKKDAQWSATDIKKSSLGGNSIFNTCNFGILMTHGSYGNTGSAGTEDDNIRYTYCWLGGNDYVRLSDMDFGSDGTNGLRWMTIFACNILKPENYSSMANHSLIPVNDNLHLLLGFSTTGYAASNLGKYYANYLTATNYSYSVVNSLADACADAYTECKPGSITNIVRIRISGWGSCFNDSLQLYNDPDLNTIDYQDRTVFIPQ